MSEKLFFNTTFGEKLPVVLVTEKYFKDGHSGYINVIVDCCPICGKHHEYLSDIFTFDRHECGNKSFVTLKIKDAGYVLQQNGSFVKEQQS